MSRTKQEHTQGPWTVERTDPSSFRAGDRAKVRIVAPSGRVCIVSRIASEKCGSSEQIERPLAEVDANARRIVACVNACQGISTESLEGGVVKELVEAVRIAANDFHNFDDEMLCTEEKPCTYCRVLAKATGVTK